MRDQRTREKAERCRVTFLGHSSALITMEAMNSLSDPNFSRHLFFFIRPRNRIPAKVRNLPRIDLMSPEDAIEAGRRLRAKVIVPIHWGAFKLSLERFDEPVPRLEEAAREAGLSSSVRILLPGQSISIDDTSTQEGGTPRPERQPPH